MSDTAASTIKPTKLGKHLRTVRRKKGLSLSEVARGAGLSRRELVAYERGKVPIPESDLWVLAGSCGVDVGDLLPPTPVPELAAIPTSIGDTVALLRHHRDSNDSNRYLATLRRLRELPAGSPVPVEEHELQAMAEALGREPEVVESRLRQMMNVSPDEAAHMRSLILPTVHGRPRVPALTAANGQPAHSVDVFQELSQLPEPPELPDPTVPIDLLAPPPMGTTEMIDNEFASFDSQLGSGYAAEHRLHGDGFHANGLQANGMAAMPEPVLVDSAASYVDIWNAADAPPIDVAFRGSSMTGRDPIASETDQSPAAVDAQGSPWPTSWENPTTELAGHPSPDASDWEPAGWDTRSGDRVDHADSGPSRDLPSSLWETTDTWTPDDELHAAQPLSAPASPPAPWDVHDVDDPATSWPTDPATSWPTDPATSWPTDPATSWPTEVTTGADLTTGWLADPVETAAAGETYPGWGRDPDPEATNTGFYVDWGAVEPAADVSTAPDAGTAAVDDPWTAGWPPAEIGTEAPSTGDPIATEPDDGLEPIVWRAEPALSIPPTIAFPAPAPTAETADRQPEQFIRAGTDWQLGNALPLVEVRGTGSLVMRRADERWALADVNTTRDFVLEVDVDFRSGPGVGILFCASIDTEGRMSGYSFDIDPIYDGGGYLVRQWQNDRELWNPIARVSAGDPTTMCGGLAVRLVVDNDCLVASVNGAQVLTVASLKQASADRGRDPASGNRVGVQAWSSSDLIIDTLRVAPR